MMTADLNYMETTTPPEPQQAESNNRARFFVRANSKKAFDADNRRSRLSRWAMTVFLFICLQMALSVAIGNMGQQRALQVISEEQSVAAQLVATEPVKRHLRPQSVTSLYDKNYELLVKVIKDHEWMDHAYLSIPKAETVTDDHVWSKDDKKGGKTKEQESDEKQKQAEKRDQKEKQAKGGKKEKA